MSQQRFNYLQFGWIGMLPNATTPINLTLSDSYSFSDSTTVTLLNSTLTLSLNDHLTFTDSIFLATGGILELTLTDALTFSSNAALSLSLPIVASDGWSFTDTVGFHVDIAILNLTDGWSFSDSFSLTQPASFIVFGDFMNFVDSVRLALMGTNMFSDSFAFDDNISFMLSHEPAFTDTLTLSDNVQLSLTASLNLNLSDSFNFYDPDPILFVSTDFTAYIRRYLNDVQ
jgi:hypothetical protein